jgi:hypothetical protein
MMTRISSHEIVENSIYGLRMVIDDLYLVGGNGNLVSTGSFKLTMRSFGHSWPSHSRKASTEKPMQRIPIFPANCMAWPGPGILWMTLHNSAHVSGKAIATS